MPSGLPPVLRALPRYEIRRQIGAGGMGVVYVAWDSERATTVALKTLSRLDPAGLTRLKREFRTLRDLRHPNVVSLGELFEEQGQWFFSMEYVSGVDFVSWVRPSGALDGKRLRRALIQLCVGVDAIHAAGKLHRDLKPSNVLVTTGGRVVVLDFGLAADIERSSRETELAGTPGYMAPEQALGSGIGPWTDWFSVGILLHEALTGRAPHGAQSGSIRDRATVFDRGSAIDHTVAEPAVGAAERDLARLCVDLRQVDPRQRPTGTEILERLGQRPAGRRMQPLFGRDRELAEISGAYDRVRRGGVESLLVLGPAGIGKTALVRHFVQRQGMTDPPLILYGRCSERESVAFKGVDEAMDALAEHLAALPADELARVMPPDTSLIAGCFSSFLRLVRAPESRPVDTEMLPALWDLLGRVSRRRPIVLVIEDVQWSDRDSRMILRSLAEPPAAARPFDMHMLVLLTLKRVHTDSPLPDFARSMPVLRLTELSAEAARNLAAWITGGHGWDGDGDAARVIAKDSHGLPSLIESLARSVIDRAPVTASPRVPLHEPAAPATVNATEPCARKTLFVAFREAAQQLWGDAGLRDIARRLPDDVRRDTIESPVIAQKWLPERYVMAWYESAWSGPAEQQAARFRLFIDRMMDSGFGRVRKVLLARATPPQLLEQAPELWRHDHTHGELICDIKPKMATLTLRDHQYTTTSLSRLAVAEIYRYAVSLSRTARTEERHKLVDGDLQVVLEWP
jgi:hypothetical protein